eukprot:gene12487-biopygen12546
MVASVPGLKEMCLIPASWNAVMNSCALSGEGTPAAMVTPSIGIPARRRVCTCGYCQPQRAWFRNSMFSVTPSPSRQRSWMYLIFSSSKSGRKWPPPLISI